MNIEEHLGSIWCRNREPSSSWGLEVRTGIQERLEVQGGLSGSIRFG